MARFLYVYACLHARYLVMKYTILILVGAATALLSPVGWAEHEGGQHGVASSELEVVQPPAQRRLRFRDGPVCMCSQGMSEEDIRRSQDSREKPRWQRN